MKPETVGYIVLGLGAIMTYTASPLSLTAVQKQNLAGQNISPSWSPAIGIAGATGVLWYVANHGHPYIALGVAGTVVFIMFVLGSATGGW